MKNLQWFGWFMLAWLVLIFIWAPLAVIAYIGKIFCWLANKVAIPTKEVFEELQEELKGRAK